MYVPSFGFLSEASRQRPSVAGGTAGANQQAQASLCSLMSVSARKGVWLVSYCGLWEQESGIGHDKAVAAPECRIGVMLV
jgi:hypothetical protein